MITSLSVPSQATASNLLANSGFAARGVVAISNHGNATVYFSFDDSPDVTVATGAKPGVPLPAGATHYFSRNAASPSSNTGGLWVVQQSGSAQLVSAQFIQA
jgi:hypothetical protein